MAPRHSLLFIVMILACFAMTKARTKQHSVPVNVAVVTIDDHINDSHPFKTIFNKICTDKNYSAILLIADSGGGSAAAVSLIADEIDFCKSHKPIVALVTDLCASGCYWLATATDYIVASPNSFVGSIGVISFLPKESNSTITVSRKSEKIIFSTDFTILKNPESTNSTQLHIRDNQEVYEEFKGQIQENRPNLDADSSEVWADGKIFTGRRALQLKLIDEVGSFSEALDAIIRLLKIEGICTKAHKITLVPVS